MNPPEPQHADPVREDTREWTIGRAIRNDQHEHPTITGSPWPPVDAPVVVVPKSRLLDRWPYDAQTAAINAAHAAMLDDTDLTDDFEAAKTIALAVLTALADPPLGRVEYEQDSCKCDEPTCPRHRGFVRDGKGAWRRAQPVKRVEQRGGDERGQERDTILASLLETDDMATLRARQLVARAALPSGKWQDEGVWATVVIDPETMEPTEITDRRFLEELSETGVSLERMFIQPGKPRVEHKQCPRCGYYMLPSGICTKCGHVEPVEQREGDEREITEDEVERLIDKLLDYDLLADAEDSQRNRVIACDLIRIIAIGSAASERERFLDRLDSACVAERDRSARIIRGLLYNDDDRTPGEWEDEAAQFLSGHSPAKPSLEGGER